MNERIQLPPASPEEREEIRRKAGLKEAIVVSDYDYPASDTKSNSRHVEPPHDPPVDARGIEVPSRPVIDGLLRGVSPSYHETEGIDPSDLPEAHDPFKK